MSYTQTINPLTGIVCIPYWYILLLIMLTWIQTLIEFGFVWCINKWYNNTKQTMNDHEFIQTEMRHRIPIAIKSIFNNIWIDGKLISWPNEITSIVLSMLPSHPNWDNYQFKPHSKTNQIQAEVIAKANRIGFLPWIYPIARFVINSINCINLSK